MPIYEYACESCQREFEELVFRQDEVVHCPTCGSDQARKLMSIFATTGSTRLRGGSCGSCSGGNCSGCGSH
jgi:putative FmdB family regulatory protein